MHLIWGRPFSIRTREMGKVNPCPPNLRFKMLYNFGPSTWKILTQTAFEWDGHGLRLLRLKLKPHEADQAGLAVNLLKQSEVDYEKLYFARLVFVEQQEGCCFQSFQYQFKDQNSRDEISAVIL